MKPGDLSEVALIFEVGFILKTADFEWVQVEDGRFVHIQLSLDPFLIGQEIDFSLEVDWLALFPVFRRCDAEKAFKSPGEDFLRVVLIFDGDLQDAAVGFLDQDCSFGQLSFAEKPDIAWKSRWK